MAQLAKAKKSNGNDFGLNFEAQLWAAAEQAVPAPHHKTTEYNRARPEGLGFSNPKSEWFIKDEPQRTEAAENRDTTIREANINTGATFSWRAWEAQYLAANVFWLPPEARWHTIKAKAKSPEIGKVIDEAMIAIERENPALKGVLPRDYARPSLDTATRASANRICASYQQDFCAAKDHVRLGGLVDIISHIGFNESAAKSSGGRPQGLGRVYEYFLAPWESVPAPAFGSSVQDSPTGRGKFASAEGTLQSAKTICGNRRMKRVFSLSASNGERAGVRCRNYGMNRRGVQNFRGQRWPCASTTTWKLARMNLAIRDFSLSASNEERVGVRCRIPRNADSFRQDLHPDLKADFVPVRKDLANPPFNMGDWGGENPRQDMRWKFGMPLVNKAV